MFRVFLCAFAAGALAASAAVAEPLSLHPQYAAAPAAEAPPTPPASVGVITAAEPEAEPPPAAPTRLASAERGNLGGGFIEFLFGGDAGRPAMQVAPQPLRPFEPPRQYGRREPAASVAAEPSRAIDPQYLPREVTYDSDEKAGTIVIDTPNRFLYLVEDGGKARRYGIGVGRPGFTWAGVKTVSAKREWPDWVPPPEMLQRRPDLPRFMPGGPDNPLGARAMYLGSSLYRIHGSNEPWTIGHAVSSGCIRMRNEDVIDLYDRVKVGTTVRVI